MRTHAISAAALLVALNGCQDRSGEKKSAQVGDPAQPTPPGPPGPGPAQPAGPTQPRNPAPPTGRVRAPLPDDLLAPIERKIAAAPSLSMAFEAELTLTGGDRMAFRGMLKVKPGNRFAFDISMDGTPPTTVRFRSDGERLSVFDGSQLAHDETADGAADFMVGMWVRGGMALYMGALPNLLDELLRGGFPAAHELYEVSEVEAGDKLVKFRSVDRKTGLDSRHELALDDRGLPTRRTATWQTQAGRAGTISETYSAVVLEPLPDSDFTIEP